MNTIKMIIPGIPKPKQSARFRIAKFGTGKQFIQSYQPKEIVEEERSIRLVIKEQLPKDFVILKGEVVVTKLHYVFPPLSNFSQRLRNEISAGKIIYKTTKPDLTDNLNKGLFDAMQGIIFLNDSQICELNNVKKFYGYDPRTEIELTFNDSGKPVAVN